LAKETAAYDSGMRGKERKKPKLEGGAESISIRTAENGYIVDCSYPPKKNAPWDWRPETHIFKTAAEIAEFIEERLGVSEED
jgi:hypothetical protein